jgi:hypothetical protein
VDAHVPQCAPFAGVKNRVAPCSGRRVAVNPDHGNTKGQIMKRIRAGTAIALALGVGAAWAGVEVKFDKPENFVDAGERLSVRDRDDTLKWLSDALTERANAVLPPGQDMVITVKDVDLAGDVHPVGRHMQMIRVVKPVYRPRIELSYAITQGGKTVREGSAEIQDLAFMDRYNRYFRDDPLYYEKPMLDDWFDKEFGKPAKQVSAFK